MPCTACRSSTSAGGRGSDVGVAVAVPADPAAEAQRAGVDRERDPEPGHLVARAPRARPAPLRRPGPRGSRRRCAPRRPAPAARPGSRRSATAARPPRPAGGCAARPSGSSSRAATRRSLSSVDRRATSVGCAVNTGRTVTCGSSSASVAASTPASAIRVSACATHRPGVDAGASVHLLGDVGEVEVRRERARQPGRRREVELGQLLEPVVLGVRADRLHQVEQLRALHAGQGLPEDRGDQTDVVAQSGVGRALGWIVHIGIIRTLPCSATATDRDVDATADPPPAT